MHYWSPPEERRGLCNLSKLLRDMSNYYITPGYQTSHTGDLMDHSLWTYYLLVNQTQLPRIYQPWYLQDISSSYYPVLQVSGLLHDVGKAGDLNLEYTQKPNHPLQSWVYFHEGNYHWVDRSKISLTEYLSQNCGLTPEEWNLVSIIAALHYDLGDFFEKKLSGNELIYRLKSHIQSTGISFDPVIVFRILRAVTFADIWAQHPVFILNEQRGFVQIDPDIVPQPRREFVLDNNYLNEEKFSLTRQLENQIINYIT